MILYITERLQFSTAEQKTSVINWSGQRLEDKLKQDGFPSFSGENRSAALNVSELLTWTKWSYCFNKRPARPAENSPCPLLYRVSPHRFCFTSL